MRRSERFPSRFVKAADLKPEGVTVIIDRLEMEEIGQGKDKEEKPVLYFKNASKALVLNSTNDAKLCEILGTDDDREWRGQKAVLFPTQTSFGKDMVDCIRIRAVDDGKAAAAAAAVEEESENPAPKSAKKSSLPSKDESDYDVDLNDEVSF